MVKNKQIVFLNFVLLQMFLSCFIAVSYLQFEVCDWRISISVIFVTVVTIGLLSIWTVKELLRLVKKESETEIALARFEENKALVRALKVKQHDFANHIQVIHGLVYQGKLEQLQKYFKSITNDLKILDRLTGLKSPELAALINKKMTMYDDIKVEPVIETDLAFLNVPADKMVSILGNLLDNAIFAEKNNPSANEKKVALKIYEEDGSYVFQVGNSGFIPYELQQRIFEPGFTTKGDKGSGMGLYIVKNFISQFGGNLDFISDADRGTNFTITFPLCPKESKLEETQLGD